MHKSFSILPLILTLIFLTGCQGMNFPLMPLDQQKEDLPDIQPTVSSRELHLALWCPSSRDLWVKLRNNPQTSNYMESGPIRVTTFDAQNEVQFIFGVFHVTLDRKISRRQACAFLDDAVAEVERGYLRSTKDALEFCRNWYNRNRIGNDFDKFFVNNKNRSIDILRSDLNRWNTYREIYKVPEYYDNGKRTVGYPKIYSIIAKQAR